MATLFYSQTIYTKNSQLEDKKSEIPQEELFSKEYSLAGEVLELAEIKNTKNAVMFINQTVSDEYKKASEFLKVTQNPKSAYRKKNMKELMQQSFFHGASWIGYNFIA